MSRFKRLFPVLAITAGLMFAMPAGCGGPLQTVIGAAVTADRDGNWEKNFYAGLGDAWSSGAFASLFEQPTED